ncbi:MAG: TRAP-type mannitol/chloroaromatic compound transport system permease small subunit [Gammaproteobacteria bacterium]
MELPDTRLSRLIDPLIIRVGEVVSWLWLMLMITIVGNVVLRYAFDQGRVEFEEIQWHIYACGFLLGLAYAYQADSHIRVDVLHERLTERTQAWIELYGTLLFVLPFIAVILIFGVPFVSASFHMHEVSQAPGGLPLRWLIKAALPTGFALLLIATISRLSRVWSLLFLTPEASRGAE